MTQPNTYIVTAKHDTYAASKYGDQPLEIVPIKKGTRLNQPIVSIEGGVTICSLPMMAIAFHSGSVNIQPSMEKPSYGNRAELTCKMDFDAIEEFKQNVPLHCDYEDWQEKMKRDAAEFDAEWQRQRNLEPK